MSLEKLLVHPAGFGLETATPVQRAFCRVGEGKPLGELAADPNVIRSFGGPEGVAELAALEGTTPLEVYLLAAIRCGKSLIAACAGVWCGLTADLSILGPNEIARVPIVSLDLDKAEIILEHLRGAAARPFLRKRLVGKMPEPGSKTGRVRFRRDDGRVFEVKIMAGKKAGGSLVSRWCAAVILDECARMAGAEEGVINFDDSRKAVLGRIRPGGMLLCPSSPWAPRGPVYEAVMEGHGHPTVSRVVIRATGPEMAPMIWTPEACEKLKTSDQGAYLTDVAGEFADPATAYFVDVELRACTRDEEHREYDAACTYVAVMDPATRSNAWTFVIVGRRSGGTGNAADDEFFIAYHRQWQGSKLAPLKAQDVLPEVKPVLEEYKIPDVSCDQWGGDLLIEHGEICGVAINVIRSTTEQNSKRTIDLKSRVNARKLELPPDPVVRSDLASTKKLLTRNGMVFDWPVTSDGRHCDYAPAIILGVDLASSAESWSTALGTWAAGGFQ